VIARFAAVVLLPSPGPGLVTQMSWSACCSALTKVTLVLSARYASLVGSSGAACEISEMEARRRPFRCGPSCAPRGSSGIRPSTGISSARSTSAAVLIVWSRYSRKNAATIPRKSPTSSPIVTFRRVPTPIRVATVAVSTIWM
jgi:hypothetical protein